MSHNIAGFVADVIDLGVYTGRDLPAFHIDADGGGDVRGFRQAGVDAVDGAGDVAASEAVADGAADRGADRRPVDTLQLGFDAAADFLPGVIPGLFRGGGDPLVDARADLFPGVFGGRFRPRGHGFPGDDIGEDPAAAAGRGFHAFGDAGIQAFPDLGSSPLGGGFRRRPDGFPLDDFAEDRGIRRQRNLFHAFGEALQKRFRAFAAGGQELVAQPR